MCDKEAALDILKQTYEATITVMQRFKPVKKVDDFADTPKGKEKLDAICMLIIAIGESLKNVDKITNCKLLIQYPEIDWKGIKGIRDIISHHYFDIDAEEIFWICKYQITPLSKTVAKIISDMK